MSNVSKKNQPKEKNPKADKIKNIVAVVALVAGGGFVAWDYGLIPGASNSGGTTFNSPSSSELPTSPSPASLPPGAEFVQSNDTTKPSKIIQKAPPPARVQSAKGLKDIVTDYVDASKDKGAAIDSLNYTMMLPAVNKQFNVQDKKTQIAKLRFEELEWNKKINELESSNTNVDDNFSKLATVEDYSDRIEGDISTEEDVDVFEGPSAASFVLDGVTQTKEGYVAHLRIDDRTLRVKDKSIIYGYYTVRLKDIDDVALCHDGSCVSVF